MTQRDRDRLVVLRKAQKKLINQQQAAAELVEVFLESLQTVKDLVVAQGLDRIKPGRFHCWKQPRE
jgi:light-regulated signal transduction histidine kinase (bacteriophytochrome)